MQNTFKWRLFLLQHNSAFNSMMSKTRSFQVSTTRKLQTRWNERFATIYQIYIMTAQLYHSKNVSFIGVYTNICCYDSPFFSTLYSNLFHFIFCFCFSFFIVILHCWTNCVFFVFLDHFLLQTLFPLLLKTIENVMKTDSY